MAELMEKAQLRSRLGNAAKLKAEKGFSLENIVYHYGDIINEIISKLY